jgi:deazaflavin-dependent oxidoreductase (nitroreductase family)
MPRSLVMLFWRLVNPITRPLAGFAPWWVLVETQGRRTGKRRRTPLAAGPRQADGMVVIAVHGRSSGWVLNAEANSEVQIRHNGRWRRAHAEILPWDPEAVRTFNFYARSGPRFTAKDPVLVRFSYN